MNLDFGILWIEDSFNSEEETALIRRVANSGFIAKITNIPNGDDLNELARQHNLYHRFDLILLDYKLKNQDGDELAPIIRSLFPSTTILFYSGNYPDDKLRQLIAEKKVEGVYCCKRASNAFIDRAGNLIDQTAKSLNRLSGMRGLAMRVVAECDELMKHAITTLYEADTSCSDMVTELDTEVIDSIESLQTKYVAAQSLTLNDRFNTRAIDSMKLHKHFRLLIKKITKNGSTFNLTPEQADRVRELSIKSKHYQTEVLERRNILGHVKEVEKEDGWYLEGNNALHSRDFPELRRVFAARISDFTEIVNIITTSASSKPS